MTTKAGPDKNEGSAGSQAIGANDGSGAVHTLLVAKGGAIVFAGTVGGYTFGYAFYFLIARLFGPARFGEYVLALNISRVLVVICVLGLDAAIIRFVAKYHSAGDTAAVRSMTRLAFRLGIPALLLGAMGLFILSGTLAEHVFGQPRMTQLLWGVSAAIPFLGVTMLLTACTTALCMPAFATLFQDFGDWVFRLTFTVVFVAVGMGFAGVILGHTLAAIVLAFLAYFSFKKMFWNRFSGPSTPVSMWPKLRFALPQVMIHLVHLIVKTTDIVLLGHFKGTEASGIYAAASQLAIAGTVFLASFSMILSPLISALHDQSQMPEVGRLLKLSTKWAISLALPYYLLLALFAIPVLTLYGGDFERGSISLMVLSAAYLIETIAGLVYFVLVMSGRQVLEMYFSMALCTANIVLNILLIPRYGMLGAAAATGFVFIAFAVVRAATVYRLYRIHSFSVQLFKPLIAGASASAVTLLLLRWTVGGGVPGLVLTLLMVVTFVLIYASFFLLGRLSPEDREVLNAIKSRLGLKTIRDEKKAP